MLVSTSRLESRSLDPKAKALPSAQVIHHVKLFSSKDLLCGEMFLELLFGKYGPNAPKGLEKPLLEVCSELKHLGEGGGLCIMRT